MSPSPTPCPSLQSVAQSPEKAPNPASIHPLLQLSDVMTHQPVWVLFSLSLSLAFLLPPTSAYLPSLSFSSLAFPSTSSLFHETFILLPPAFSSLSSFSLLSLVVSPSFPLLPNIIS